MSDRVRIFKRRALITATTLLAAACSAQPTDTGGGNPTPGSTGGTFTTGSGGSGATVTSSGGFPFTTGGTTGTTGGTTGTTGGTTGTTGGTTGTTGGTTGTTGGTTGTTGGTTGTTGGTTTGTGGGAGAGMAGAGSVMCEAAFGVTADGFVRAPGASGCWHGYASAGGDAGSTVMPADFAMCGAGCMLSISGTVGAATEANSYAGVVYLGFNVSQETGSSTKGTLTPTGTGLAVNYTSTGAITRVQISSGSSADTRWCAELTTSGTVVPYTMFNTHCWNTAEAGAKAYAKEPIDTVQLIIPGGDAAASFSLALTSVQDM